MNHRSAVRNAVAFALVALPALAGADPIRPAPNPTVAAPSVRAAIAAATVDLGCSGSGASDVASRKHSIKNTTAFAIGKGTTIVWNASNKGSGKVVLENDLASGASVDVIEPGQTNGYSCTAVFIPGPADLAVKSVQWAGPSRATVEIVNLNPWTGAGASTARIASMKCVTTPVKSLDIGVPAIAKGGSTTLMVDLPKGDADYLIATANVDNAVTELEANKANNVRRSVEFATTKSCTPQ